jgi:hypothetical protein
LSSCAKSFPRTRQVGSLYASFSVVSGRARQIARSLSTAVGRGVLARLRRRFADRLRRFIAVSLANSTPVDLRSRLAGNFAVVLRTTTGGSAMAILAELFRIVLIALLFTFLLGPGSPAGAESFDVTSLVTDDQNAHPAQITDPTLQNAWGVSYATTGSPFWVSSNGGGVANLYNVNPTTNVTTKAALTVTIPPPAGSPAGTRGTPTGQAFNSTGAGASARPT